jgi:CO/xanthine dehydrogenase Mo-binding subunit
VNGAAQQQNINDYQMARMNTAPHEIYTYLVGSEDWNQPFGGGG